MISTPGLKCVHVATATCSPCCSRRCCCCASVAVAAVVSWCCICRFDAPAIGNWRTSNGQWPTDKGQRSRPLSLSGQWAEETRPGPCSCLCASEPLSIVQLSGCCVLCFWHPFHISGVSVCFNFVPNYCHGWISPSHYVFQSVLMPQTVLKVGEVNQIINQGRIWFSYIFSIHKSLWVSKPKVRLMPQTVLKVGEVNQIINQGRFWFSYIFSICTSLLLKV